jgi:hypothetical protein
VSHQTTVPSSALLAYLSKWCLSCWRNLLELLRFANSLTAKGGHFCSVSCPSLSIQIAQTDNTSCTENKGSIRHLLLQYNRSLTTPSNPLHIYIKPIVEITVARISSIHSVSTYFDYHNLFCVLQAITAVCWTA